MYLKTINIKGFKSFPNRTKLVLDKGVSVVVGPNGSGKSNVTDAILWALGEQRPLAIRGQTMQDIIFSGGRGVKARDYAEVELVLDNSDGAVAIPYSEISVLRRLDRSGEGEYRLNGSRCRLSDVQEILSDTGLGKEAHSVVSQGRVESIVTSKPKDRRLLIEEAAGLGKHRKRRRRAQLKLDRTRSNLDQALLVEQEARKQLAPLKRQSEAAELHQRLQRQMDELRLQQLLSSRSQVSTDLAAAESEVTEFKATRSQLNEQRSEITARRQQAEESLSKQAEVRQIEAAKVQRISRSAERIELRLERAKDLAAQLDERVYRTEAQLDQLLANAQHQQPDLAGSSRIERLKQQLADLDKQRALILEQELVALQQRVDQAEDEAEQRKEAAAESERNLAEAEKEIKALQEQRSEFEKRADGARRDAAAIGSKLAAVNQFLRNHGPDTPGQKSLQDLLKVTKGVELALAAALDGRLSALIGSDQSAAFKLLERAGGDGIRVLLENAEQLDVEVKAPTGLADAQLLIDFVSGDQSAFKLARRLLHNVWLVDKLPETLDSSFAGTLVTRSGLVWNSFRGELVRFPTGGSEQVLAKRNEREQLIVESESAVNQEHTLTSQLAEISDAVSQAASKRDELDAQRRAVQRQSHDAQEGLRGARAAFERHKDSPEQGPIAVQRAQLLGELQAEERARALIDEQRRQREADQARLNLVLDADRKLQPVATRLCNDLIRLHQLVSKAAATQEAARQAKLAASTDHAAALRELAQNEVAVSNSLSSIIDRLTQSEVKKERSKDRLHEVTDELNSLLEKLGLPDEPTAQILEPEQLDEIKGKIERLQRRREQLGPVNPLAAQAYEDARTHVEEIETQRNDLETALRELQTFLRDTDKQIRETFEETFNQCAKNFEELVTHVFPGGKGQLRLVKEEKEEGTSEDDSEATFDDAENELGGKDELYGVEIEVMPAGKSKKRLTLLSGGEKSMTAIAFLFSVFLAKPCPFYVLDEVEAALDDLNIDRFLQLLKEYKSRAQFIVVTHQKRTMEVADSLYGVSMGGDGVSKVVSRRLRSEDGLAVL